jgi:4-aminobutyrate aminotransferase-like enzyme
MSSAPTLESPAAMTTEEVVAVTKKLNYGTWRYQKSWKPMHVVDAEGCYFIDAAGKRYLDFSSQLMCVNLGHKNKAVIKAIQDQAATLPYIMPGYATTTRAELSKLLLEVLPAGLEKFFFTTSGTEANEAAFKIARMYTIAPTTVPPTARSPPPAIRAAGQPNPAAKLRTSSSLPKSTATSARSNTPTLAVTSPAPIISST